MSEEKAIQFDELIFERIIDIGCEMLKAGGEIQRVEQTISLLCSSYGAKTADVFTITSSIVVTVRFENRPSMTQTRRIISQQSDMKRLEYLNGLSRKICSHLMTNEEIRSELKRFDEKGINKFLMPFVWAVVSACFTIFFGGSTADAVCSLLIGAMLYSCKYLILKHIKDKYCSILICSALGGISATLFSMMIDSVRPFYINIGNIMLLIPGVALTTAIKDMFIGDTISGLLRFFEALLTSLVIAWGFALFDKSKIIINDEHFFLVEIIAAFIGSFGFSIIFNCRSKIGIISSFGAMLGWGIICAAKSFGISEYLAFFLAAVFIKFFAEAMARRVCCPATPFLLVGIIPLVPGKALYTTMRYALNDSGDKFIDNGIMTVMFAALISAGIITVFIFYNNFIAQKTDQ